MNVLLVSPQKPAGFTALGGRSPTLDGHQTRLYGFARPYFVGQDDAFGQMAVEGKERCLDLMWVQVYLCVHQGGGQHVGGVGAHAAGKEPSYVLGLVGG